jgi:hypothetical protein
MLIIRRVEWEFAPRFRGFLGYFAQDQEALIQNQTFWMISGSTDKHKSRPSMSGF